MRIRTSLAVLVALAATVLAAASSQPATRGARTQNIFIFPYFLNNGEAGIYLALSHDGFNFEGVNDNRPILPAPDWPRNRLTRDPSIVYRNGTFHMVWTTDWGSRSIGYASSPDLVTWSEPRRIDVWGEMGLGVLNTWAPELHWDPQEREFFILFSSTLESELFDGDGSEDPHDLDHRVYVIRTRDFEKFTRPELFYSPQPEHGVIDPQVVLDDRDTADARDDRWVMVIKNEMGPDRGGKNLRLAFARQAGGPYDAVLGHPVVGEGTAIVGRMAEGPSLVKTDGLWHLYWDAPGAAYCLATSRDLTRWKDRSTDLRMPVPHPRHGTVALVPASAIGWLRRE